MNAPTDSGDAVALSERSPRVRSLDAVIHRLGLDRIAFRIWRYSPRGLLRLYRHHAFDRRLGVDTRGYSDLRYEPTPSDVFLEMMSRLPVERSDFVFVDLGSGKGKVLLLAAQHSFRRVVGVELWEDLHRTAIDNVRLFRERGLPLSPIETLRLDAAEFEYPDEPLVLYLFNPFPEPVVRRVLQNLKRSLEEAPRPAYVLFYAPVRRRTPWDRRRAFESAGFLRVLEDDPRFTIYTAHSA